MTPKRLEIRAKDAYPPPMDDTTHYTDTPPAGWLEILAESEAEADAGLFVDGDAILHELDQSIARMERSPAAAPRLKVAPRR